MAKSVPSDTVRDLLGSTEVFHSAINELVTRHLREVSQERLTFTQLRLLQLFSITDDHSVSDVAKFLDVSNAAASRAVDWLVKHRYVRRTQRPSDRRAVKLALTPTGRRMLNAFEDNFLEVVTEMLGGVSAEELERTVGILDRLSVQLAHRLDAEGDICFRCGLHFRKKCPLRDRGGGAERVATARSKPREASAEGPSTQVGILDLALGLRIGGESLVHVGGRPPTMGDCRGHHCGTQHVVSPSPYPVP